MAMTNTGMVREIWARLPLTVCVLFLSPVHVLASGPGSDFQFDPVEHWAARILTWVLVSAVVLVGYALFSILRGGLANEPGKLLMLVGIVLLPSFSVATGMLLVFIRAERVEFCASCHQVMQEYADDMTDPDGTRLAAVHFVNQYIPSNQCYECHTSYGLFGTVEAKLHGVGEVFRYYSRTYDMPIEMWQPYSNNDCLKCHADSKKWLSLEAHTDEDMQEQLFEDRTSCMSCHDPAHNVRDAAAEEDS